MNRCWMTVLEVICAHLRQKSNLLLGVWIYNGSNGPPQGIEYPVFRKEIRHAVGKWLIHKAMGCPLEDTYMSVVVMAT
jgi:hypothetical protein